jgi:hypothetical protein
MNLFRVDLGQLAYQDVVDFCSQGIPEGVRVEYKRQLSTTQPEKQLTKAVSALANTQGGILVYGVGTVSGGRQPDWPSDGMPHDPNFEQKAIRWCIEHIDPPVVPSIGYVTNPNDGTKGFAILRVEPSEFTPHTVEQGTRFYVRRADNSDPVDGTIREIELLRDRRSRELELSANHEADLRRRVGLDRPTPQRSFALVLAPMFGSDDAVAMTDLPAIATRIELAGFRVGEVASYSHGVLCKHPAGFVFAITGRAALACRFLFPNPAPGPPEPINLGHLLSWSLMATRSVEILADASGYWGWYKATFEAAGHGAIRVVDGNDEYRPCADNDIVIHETWTIPAIREDRLAVAGRFYRQMMWSFGQHNCLWSDSIIRARMETLIPQR